MTKTIPLPAVEYLRRRLALSADGVLTWRARPTEEFSAPRYALMWHKRFAGKKAGIHVSGKDIYLGLFDDLADAALARQTAEEKYFGAFAPSIKKGRK